MGKYALLKDAEVRVAPAPEDFKAEVLEVLTTQLGHRSAEARRMVDEAMRRQPGISSAEELFQEVYRIEKDGGRNADTTPLGRVRGAWTWRASTSATGTTTSTAPWSTASVLPRPSSTSRWPSCRICRGRRSAA